MRQNLGDSARLELLLRRAGFAADPAELDRYQELGWEGTLDQILHPELATENFDALLQQLQGNLLDLQNLEDVQTWWLYRMVQTRRPLLEKLTLFWHSHFAVANSKVNNPRLMHQYVERLRAHALGGFHDLLLEMSRDPAMLIWLDGSTNRKAAPNENYAREIMELFTVGIGHYTEADVQAAARAFTGWNLRNGEFFFDAGQHDPGQKTFLGKTGPLDGGDVVAGLASHPATAERISRKLFEFLAYPEPEPDVLEPLVAAFTDSGLDVARLVEAILRSDAFYSDRSRFEHVKSPVEFVVDTVRLLGASVRERELVSVLRSLGQEILNPPNVAGWPGGSTWINPTTLLTRFNFAARLAAARGQPNDGAEIKPDELLGLSGVDDPPRLVEQVLARLGRLELAPEAHQALIEYVQAPLAYPPGFNGTPNAQQKEVATDARVRGTILLALASSDYQIG